MSFACNSSGKWTYKSNELKVEYALGFPMPDGSLGEIKHLSVDTAKETLRVFVCPSGDARAQFLSMLQKGQRWIDRAVESYLQRRDI